MQLNQVERIILSFSRLFVYKHGQYTNKKHNEPEILKNYEYVPKCRINSLYKHKPLEIHKDNVAAKKFA